MNVKGRTEVAEARTKSELLNSDAARLLRAKTDSAELARKLKDLAPGSESGSDRIELGLARAIFDELNPENLVEERRQKVERLKNLVASGRYQVPALELAQAIYQEISMDILATNVSEDVESE